MRASRPSGAERTTTVDEKKSLYSAGSVRTYTYSTFSSSSSLSLSPLRNRRRFPLPSRWTKPYSSFLLCACMALRSSSSVRICGTAWISSGNPTLRRDVEERPKERGWWKRLQFFHFPTKEDSRGGGKKDQRAGGV